MCKLPVSNTERSGFESLLPCQPEYELDSPNFIPWQLTEFADRGFERRGRWHRSAKLSVKQFCQAETSEFDSQLPHHLNRDNWD